MPLGEPRRQPLSMEFQVSMNEHGVIGLENRADPV